MVYQAATDQNKTPMTHNCNIREIFQKSDYFIIAIDSHRILKAS